MTSLSPAISVAVAAVVATPLAVLGAARLLPAEPPAVASALTVRALPAAPLAAEATPAEPLPSAAPTTAQLRAVSAFPSVPETPDASTPDPIPVVPEAGPAPAPIVDAGVLEAPAPLPVFPESAPAPPAANDAAIQYSALCGNATCSVGEVCCNASCGTCVAPGAPCDKTRCDNGPTRPYSQACGMNTCSVGSVCCDAACGLCAPADQCSHLHC